MSENNKRPTQCARLVRYMQDFKSITQMEAIQELGIMRLASRISELRKNGYEIEKRMVKGKNRYGESVSWASYSLAKAE